MAARFGVTFRAGRPARQAGAAGQAGTMLRSRCGRWPRNGRAARSARSKRAQHRQSPVRSRGRVFLPGMKKMSSVCHRTKPPSAKRSIPAWPVMAWPALAQERDGNAAIRERKAQGVTEADPVGANEICKVEDGCIGHGQNPTQGISRRAVCHFAKTSDHPLSRHAIVALTSFQVVLHVQGETP